MSTKHTPGPWHAVPNYFRDEHSFINGSCPNIGVQMPDNDLAVVTGTHREANAQLIAAAPEMFDALHEVASVLPVAHLLHPDDLHALQFKVVSAYRRAAGMPTSQPQAASA